LFVRRLVAPVTAVLSLSLAAATAGATAAPDAAPATFVGVDGLVHESAPIVVRGIDNELYPGWELDYACGSGGDTLDTWITQLGKLAAVLEKAGTRVVFTIAPGKTWGLGDRLDPTRFPHGSCDSVGIAEGNKVLDEKRPSYLPMRPLLSSRAHQMYWKTDPHWTTVGGSRFARGVAAALDRRLARRQRYAYTTETRWGNLAEDIGDPTPEVVERAIPDSGVTVRDAKGAPDWSGYPSITFDTSWVSSPAKKTWPGRTLLVGDSFTWYALESLRPVFRQGRFIWVTQVPYPQLIDAMVHADTVVLEGYSSFPSPIEMGWFRRDVKKALARQR
jgi:hypothetical protein